ncbi:MAG: SusD family protein, partial [Bacteroidetes bacterium]|nr:SusD family protein [Bacteroidota bacterium]
MKFLKYISFGFSLLLLSSCSEDYLNKMPDDKVTESEVFTRYEKVNNLVTDLYASAKSDNRPLIFLKDFGLASITDECTASNHEKAIPHQFHIGNYGPSQGMPSNSDTGEYWWSIYSNIRKANVILEGVKKYNTPDNPLEGREGDLRRRIGETFFLRGYLHYLLLRAYGEVPFLDHVVGTGDDMAFQKESFHAVVEKICADADSAYNRVDASYSGEDFGRVDKGACLGLKAMVRWMDATPMWNGGTIPNDTRVFKSEYTTYNQNRWQLAKDAAKAVMDAKNASGETRYSLYAPSSMGVDDYKDVDGKQTTNNQKVQERLWQMFYQMDAIQQEWVWFVTRDKDTGWSGDVLPPSQNGHARQRPLQNQVDEYEYISSNGYGYPIYDDRAKSDGYDD